MAAGDAAVQGRRPLQFAAQIGSSAAAGAALPLRSSGPDSRAADRRREGVFDNEDVLNGGSHDHVSTDFA